MSAAGSDPAWFPLGEGFFAHTDALDRPGALDGPERRTLVDVLDRLLDRGVVVRGDLTVSVADVDLLFVGLKLYVASVDAMDRAREAALNPLSETDIASEARQ